MKIITMAAAGLLAFASPAFAQMAPGGPADGSHGGARGPQGTQAMGDHQGGMDRGHGDEAMTGRGDSMDHRDMGGDHHRGMERAGYDRGMDRGHGDHGWLNGRHCRTVWRHHHRVRRCD